MLLGVFLTSLWLFCVLEPAIFTFCSHHIATDHSPEQMPNVHLQLSPHSYRFCAGLSSVPPLLALRIQAGCVSLVLLINLSGTRPLSHNNGFTELTTLHSLCTPPDALPTLPGQPSIAVKLRFPHEDSSAHSWKPCSPVCTAHSAELLLSTSTTAFLALRPFKTKFIKCLVSLTKCITNSLKTVSSSCVTTAIVTTMNKDFFLISVLP